MRLSTSKYALILTILCLQLNVFAQYQIGLVPRSSPDRSVYKTIGTTDITVEYGSPSVKKRAVWGRMVPYDQVWRAGANNATTIEISDDIFIQDKSVAKGRYALFIVPKENDIWTIILNEDADQWGAFKYDATKDVVSVDVQPKRSAEHVEELSYRIDHQGFQKGEIVMEWEYVQVGLKFGTDYIEKFLKEVEARVAKADVNVKWVVYLQGAEHLVNLNLKQEVAEQWLAKSEALSDDIIDWNDQFYPKEYIKGHRLWTLAKLHANKGQYPEALAIAQRVLSIGDEPLYYNRKGASENIDKLMEEWADMVD